MMFVSRCILIVLLFACLSVFGHAQQARQNLEPVQVAEAFSVALADRDEQRLLELWDPMAGMIIAEISPSEQLDAADPLAFRQLQHCALEQTLKIKDPRAGSHFPVREIHVCDIFEGSTEDVYSVVLTLQQVNEIWSVVAVSSSTQSQRDAREKHLDSAKDMALRQDPAERVRVFMTRLTQNDYAGAAELSDGIFAPQLEEISIDGESSLAWEMLEADGFFDCIKQYRAANLKIERSSSSPFEARARVCEDVTTEFGDVFRLSLWFDEQELDWKIDGIAW